MCDRVNTQRPREEDEDYDPVFWKQFFDLFKKIPFSLQVAIIDEMELAEKEGRGANPDKIYSIFSAGLAGLN